MTDLIERLRAKAALTVKPHAPHLAGDLKHYVYDAGTRELLEEAADALEAAREDAWQPIETAPKDGTNIIGFWMALGVVNGTNYGITAFNPESGAWYDASEPDNEDDEWARPDFWRPLPAPPAIDQARGKEVP